MGIPVFAFCDIKRITAAGAYRPESKGNFSYSAQRHKENFTSQIIFPTIHRSIFPSEILLPECPNSDSGDNLKALFMNCGIAAYTKNIFAAQWGPDLRYVVSGDPQ